ncbi:tRNA threonylcarbamoyladenosine dehydratase [Marichromatium gracile]|uniref:tRNA threonylcarbamoyladenosine dehydratase n=1 Tax=Marichromatium gracile TaxID=1048 RepID=UPI001F3B589F|nr:tRNA threonylcarbamoyladenosine dehydratase [Marichromatium gracile]MCF1182118.1 tRNA threonylcarbamoyladenosine dehydratase [Marichromatium gracile]
MSLDQPLWDRTRILVGEDGVARLRDAHVFVAGLGGVGAFAAEALARAGVGTLTLVDHDRVAPSNLNRQLVALTTTLGRPKVEVMAERVAAINPACRVRAHAAFLPAEGADAFLAERPDQLVDAIDSLASKLALIETALRLGVPVVSSMGAGGRLDPTRIQVGDLMDTRVCGLARAVRTKLRRRGVGRGVCVVWSDEEPHPPAPPEPVSQGRPRAVNGTISYLPALFGLTLAGVVIRRLLEGTDAG